MSGELDNDGFFNQLERDTLWKWVKYLEDGDEKQKMNALDTYSKENEKKLAERRLHTDREVLWSFVLDIEGVPGERWRKRKRRRKVRQK